MSFSTCIRIWKRRFLEDEDEIITFVCESANLNTIRDSGSILRISFIINFILKFMCAIKQTFVMPNCYVIASAVQNVSSVRLPYGVPVKSETKPESNNSYRPNYNTRNILSLTLVRWRWHILIKCTQMFQNLFKIGKNASRVNFKEKSACLVKWVLKLYQVTYTCTC
jgi:hypothetical protein